MIRPATFVVLVLVALLAAGTALAGVRDEPHLSPVPRSVEARAEAAARTAAPTRFDRPEPGEDRAGGNATVDLPHDRNAFSRPSANMVFARETDFLLGNELFRRSWQPAGTGDANRDGLGPLYNATSCEACHLRDGRGQPPDIDPASPALFLRLSGPGGGPDPVYGDQLQTRALPGIAPEIRLEVEYSERVIGLSGGAEARLRVPHYRLQAPGYGPLPAHPAISPRIAPPMIGLGLLEAVPAADILALADPDDRDGDGISGRASVVASREFGIPMLGRFGLKAGAATIRQQTAAALLGDMGLATSLYPSPAGACTQAQTACREAPHGAGPAHPEVRDTDLDLLVFYSRNLAVPARTNAGSPEVLRGKAVFYKTGCPACHHPAFVTHTLPDRPEQSAQLIRPFTDLLLHDMGPKLADNRDMPHATAREWRTAPLWGIGRAREVSGHGHYLHDGRARSLLEAVLWHGGEASVQRDQVISMPPADRAALIRYLESL